MNSNLVYILMRYIYFTIHSSLVDDFKNTHQKQLNFARVCKHPHTLDLYAEGHKLRIPV